MVGIEPTTFEMLGQCSELPQPGCNPCKLNAEDMPVFTITTIVICLMHTEDLWRGLHGIQSGVPGGVSLV